MFTAFFQSRQLRFFALFGVGLYLIRAFLLDSSKRGKQDFASTNPWRDLPTDSAVHSSIREVLLISDTLRDGMLPTSLTDDDYDTYSSMLRNLETRQDVTWLVIQETGVDKTIMAIANRGGHHSPIPEEPHDLHERAKKLHHHWFTLASANNKPDRWDAQFDTTYLPPLVARQGLGSGQKSDSSQLDLTPAQKAEADAKYKAYRKRRDRAVSYLKKNPPKPMAWVPVQTTPEKSRSLWESLFSDGIVKPGRKVAGGKLAGNPGFKPVYRDLITERVPYDWVDPDEPVKEYAETDHLKEMEAFREESRIRKDRTDKQAAFQDELRAEERRKRGEKEEL
ncbi:hypothetical protein CORC01_01695 [Colletotrichum orchidophilum]|uniref:Uncharacterized protein n=1 Tax=Colletotrichum orchidophilum TaxID=1209926 RepID=A0A1G4BNN6_9PEZI|nr:uncharacterized protein CORC01_01695 [Colletotrichum orchidophilum]OHF02937.1 hypothetical protein CORC01_01695 [Colletotrichum orchidophilum]